MARVPDSFIDNLRQALRIEDVVSRHVKLRREGAGFVAIDDSSLSVTPSKGMYYQFGNGQIQGGGDVFAFEMAATGCTFHEAVERLAGVAGISMPPGTGTRERPRASNGNGSNGHAPPDPEPGDPGASPDAQQAGQKSAAKRPREPAHVFPYCDADGLELYEVARFEWTDDKGVKHKSTPPRRAVPDEPGRWIWGLNGGEHLRGRTGDWYLADAKRKREWPGAESRVFDEQAKILYRMPQLLEEVLQEQDEQRTIHLPEGEKKVDALVEWGLVATTSMGGVSGWLPHYAEEFRGADVVIHADNDDVGRQLAQLKAASVKLYARRVRVLDWGQVWSDAKEGDDFIDWRDRTGKSIDDLHKIVDKLPDWTPQPPVSQFRAERFVDIDKPGPELEWLIKFVIARGEVSIWYGAPQSGKSFLITDAAFSVARGAPWMGQRTKIGLVIYQAGEGALGFRRRRRAYRKYYRIPADDDIPFVSLGKTIDLFNGDAEADKLIAECKAWAAYYGVRAPELIVIDTLNAASPGADENSSKDIGPVLARARKVSTATGAHVALIDHTPKDGSSPRGWSGKMGNVDSAILVSRTGEFDERDVLGVSKRREVREFAVTKQKDEADNLRRRFILPRVVLSLDSDGDEISSCVVVPLDQQSPTLFSRDKPKDWVDLLPANADIFRALVRALDKHGIAAPAESGEPPTTRVCKISQWQDELIEDQVGHVDVTPTIEARIKKRIYRASKYWLSREDSGGINLIHKSREWVWRSSRKVWRIDRVPKAMLPMPVEPEALRAPGESMEDLQGAFDH